MGTHREIKTDEVTTVKILNDAITTPKILNDAVTTAKILDANVTREKVEAAGEQISTTSGSFSTTSTTYVDVTSMSVSITTTGRPVDIFIRPEAGTSGFILHSMVPNDTELNIHKVDIKILRDGSTTVFEGSYQNNDYGPGTTGNTRQWRTTPAVYTIDSGLSAATYAYKVQIKEAGFNNSGTRTAELTRLQLVAVERI